MQNSLTRIFFLFHKPRLSIPQHSVQKSKTVKIKKKKLVYGGMLAEVHSTIFRRGSKPLRKSGPEPLDSFLMLPGKSYGHVCARSTH